MLRHLLICLLLLSQNAAIQAGWHYRSTYSPGYSYYNAGYYGQSYYNAGYYQYQPEQKVYVTVYNTPPVQAVAFATYQPAAVALYQTATLANVQTLQANPLPQAAVPTSHCAALEARLLALEKAAGVQSAPPPPVEQPKAQSTLDGRAVLFDKCAACHGENPKSGAKSYFGAQGLKDLSAVEVVQFYRVILSGKMPKDGKLSAEQGQAVMAFLDGVAAK